MNAIISVEIETAWGKFILKKTKMNVSLIDVSKNFKFLSVYSRMKENSTS